MSALSIADAPHGFAAKAGTLAIGTVFAGTALLGGTALAPTVAAGIAPTVQHDIMLTATPGPEVDTFVASLQNLLNTLGYGNIGDVLGLFSSKTVTISSGSELSSLLTLLNPDGKTLDGISNNLFSTDISNLLSDIKIAGPGGTAVELGTVPIDQLIGGFIGGTGADESIGAVLTALGFGPYVGLLDLPFLNLSPTDTVGSLLSDFLGITSTDTLNDLELGNGLTLGNATIGGLLGIDGTTPWDQFLDGIKLGGTIIDPGGTGTLGDETLGALLTSLLGPGATAVTDATTLTDFLGDLGIFQMLGLS